MFGLYEDPDGVREFLYLGEVYDGHTSSMTVFLVYRGPGYLRNTTIQSMSPDISIDGMIPSRIEDQTAIPILITWTPSKSDSAGGIELRAEEVITKYYGVD
jgi:hypothetical protein